MSPICNYTTTGSLCREGSSPQTCSCQNDSGSAVAGCSASQSCGCSSCQVSGSQTQNGSGCGCDSCACASSLIAALQLLCSTQFASLIDYTQFAFVGRDFVLGSSLSCPEGGTAAYDNLTGPLSGELVGTACNPCQRLAVSGQIFYANPVCTDIPANCCGAGPGFTATELSVCSILAVAFSVSDPSPVPVTISSYQQARGAFWQMMHPGRSQQLPMYSTPYDVSSCSGCDDLECRRTLSLTAGPLLLANVSVLGKLGDVYILANDVDERFYFVCADSIDFVG